jgi:hypothetical protein
MMQTAYLAYEFVAEFLVLAVHLIHLERAKYCCNAYGQKRHYPEQLSAGQLSAEALVVQGVDFAACKVTRHDYKLRRILADVPAR